MIRCNPVALLLANLMSLLKAVPLVHVFTKLLGLRTVGCSALALAVASQAEALLNGVLRENLSTRLGS